MVGNPWELPVYAEHITVEDSSGNTTSWANATSSGIQFISPNSVPVQPERLRLSGSGSGYERRHSVGLTPFVGYWIYAYGSYTLQIPDPAAPT